MAVLNTADNGVAITKTAEISRSSFIGVKE